MKRRAIDLLRHVHVFVMYGTVQLASFNVKTWRSVFCDSSWYQSSKEGFKPVLCYHFQMSNTY